MDAERSGGRAWQCRAGAMIVFDSRCGMRRRNTSAGTGSPGTQHSTFFYVKQQIDYVRALGDAVVAQLPPRSQQLSGGTPGS